MHGLFLYHNTLGSEEPKEEIVHIRYCLIVCLLILVTSAAVATPVQWIEKVGGNGHWYEYVPTALLDWGEARDAAASSSWQGLRGYLATITSAEESAWVSGNVVIGMKTWLGGYQDRSAADYSEPASGWRWITGETWSYTNWGIMQGQYITTTEPTNDALPSNPSVNDEEDWLELATAYTNSPVAWNDTTYTSWHSGQRNSSGYLVEYAIPEPSSILALLCGIGGVVGTLRRRSHR